MLRAVERHPGFSLGFSYNSRRFPELIGELSLASACDFPPDGFHNQIIPKAEIIIS